MHAIRQYEFGAPETLRYEELDDPKPGAGQVRIAVDAAGVHLVDTMIRAGKYDGPFTLPDLPMTPGREVAGHVDAVGADVDDRWLGRPVVAHLGMANGGYAELATVAATSLHELPADVDAAEAVAMIGTGRTAIALLDAARLGPGDIALVTAAAGGIGTLLVQAARNVGATVVGVAGGEQKVALVRRLGADAVVDYLIDGWQQRVRDAVGGREITVTFDGIGGNDGRGAFDLLGVGGRFLMFGYASGTATEITSADLWAKSATASVPLGPPLLRRLRELEGRSLAELAARRLVPAVNPPFRLADASAAHRAIESRQTMGKVVLIP